MEQKVQTPPPVNGGMPQKPKKKNSVWKWILIVFAAICVLGAIFGEEDKTAQSEKKQEQGITKEEWTARLMEDLQIQSEYLDSIMPRAKSTTATSMLLGYINDATKMADKTIEDSLYMDVYSTEEVKNLMDKNSSSAKKILPELKKVCRSQFAKQLKDKLWEENIDIKTSNGGTTITFIGGIFASNKNIKNWHEKIAPTLSEFGFKQANYKWIEHDTEYTYYTID